MLLIYVKLIIVYFDIWRCPICHNQLLLVVFCDVIRISERFGILLTTPIYCLLHVSCFWVD